MYVSTSVRWKDYVNIGIFNYAIFLDKSTGKLLNKLMILNSMQNKFYNDFGLLIRLYADIVDIIDKSHEHL